MEFVGDFLGSNNLQECCKKHLTNISVKERRIEIYNMFSQILTGMNYFHNLGYVHRDLKPENIFIDKNHIVKIGDFGLAKMIESENDSG